MARIDLVKIRHSYAPRRSGAQTPWTLRSIDQAFEDGGAYALLGPSGCGKTTLLNIVSGLVQPTEGRVRFGSEDVTALSTEKRNIAQVFQFPVIYDTMTVRQNLMFPLRNRGMKRKEARARVEEMLDLLALKANANRRANTLRPEEKQRIALGRGLVRSDVSAILFDEPLLMIDPLMKWVLRAQLKEMHRRFGYTMIYVTDDQTEALTFADKVVVMHEGEIVQVGSPEELFERPRHTFVGYFIGSPGMNVMRVSVDGATARLGEQSIPLPGPMRPSVAQKLELGVRPEYVRLGAEGMPANIVRIEDIGRLKIIRLKLEGRDLTAVMKEGAEVPAEPKVTFEPKGINLYADSWRIDFEGPAP